MLSTQALMFIYMLVGVIIVRAGILKPEGRPAFIGLLINVTRPEITPEDAVEDLIILAKQEVPWKDMVEVLSSLLICQPTPEMRSALKELSDRVPRWLSLSTSRVQ